MTPVDRYIIEEYIDDLVFFYFTNFRDGIKGILNIPVEFQIHYLIIEV
jgi:hypothetical protein